jgi:hypothetical protein
VITSRSYEVRAQMCATASKPAHDHRSKGRDLFEFGPAAQVAGKEVFEEAAAETAARWQPHAWGAALAPTEVEPTLCN